MKNIKIDLGESAIKNIIDRVENGLKAALKLTRENVANTIDGKGLIGPFKLNDSQYLRMQNAYKKGAGLKMTMTDKQTRDMKQGGFLAGLLPAAAGLARGLAPIVGPGILSGVAGFGANKLLGKIFGKGMKPLQMGDGLYLAPYQSGSSLKGETCKYCAVIGNAKGDRVKVTGGFLRNILGTLSGIMPF
jgi:hypothetical protein